MALIRVILVMSSIGYCFSAQSSETQSTNPIDIVDWNHIINQMQCDSIQTLLQHTDTQRLSKSGKANLLFQIGTAYFHCEENEKCLTTLNRALMQLNQKEKIKALLMIAECWTRKNELKETIKIIQELSKVYSKLTPELKINYYLATGGLYNYCHDFETSEYYYQQAYDLSKKYSERMDEITLFKVHAALLSNRLLKQKLDSVENDLTTLKKSINGSLLLENIFTENLYTFYFNTGKLKLGKELLKNQITKNPKQNVYLIGFHSQLGINLFQQTLYQEALNHFLIADTLIQYLMPMSKSTQTYISKWKGNCYRMLKKYALASECYHDFVKGNAHYLNSLHQENLHFLQFNDFVESKEMEIKNIKNENQLKEITIKSQKQFNLLIISVFGIIILIGTSVWLIYDNQFSKKYFLSEQKRLRTQMNPHFLSNSLTAIQSLILKKNPIEASEYLSQFSKLTRGILEASSVDLISLKQEIDILENYLSLQKIRCNNSFDFNIKVDNNLDINKCKLPPMLIQPFAENAIEHGFLKSDKQGEINIKIAKENQNLIIKLIDNGEGFNPKIPKDKKSFSGDITANRLKLIKKKYKKDTSLQIINIDGLGVEVIIKIPLIY